MAQPSLPVLLPKKTQEGLLLFCEQTRMACFGSDNFRNRLTYIDQEFYRENTLATGDHQVAALANRTGDKMKIASACMPIVESQVETAVSFLTSVFLQEQPIFKVVSPPEKMDQAAQMTAVIAENSIRGGWAAELIMFFRDGVKYNIHAIEIDWKRQQIYSPITNITPGQQNSVKSNETVWEGNCIHRMDPYNLLYDPRVAPHKMHTHGEFVGYTDIYSRIALKQFIQDLPIKINITEALSTSFEPVLYHVPQVNPWDNYNLTRLTGAMDWNKWAFGNTNGLDYKNLYAVTTRYIRIIPSDFNMSVPKNRQPQIWKLITVNDKVIIYAERLTNAHNFFPIVMGQPYNDGLSYQSKGMGEKLIPLQDLASASWNARLASQRRKVSDRGLYDPSRVRKDDINSDNPAAKIPVKPSVYGKDVKEAYHQIPFEDNQSGSYVQDANEFYKFANMVSGQNPAQQGQFVKGNKTQGEFDDTMRNSSGRQQTGAIFIENQVFGPVKEMIKLNILQYQPTGDIVNPIDGQTYTVNTEELRKSALTFKVSDGLVPADKLIDAPTLQIAIQAVATSPELQQEFQLGPMFAYLMSIKGVDLKPFILSQQQKQANAAQQIRQQATQTAADNAATTATNPPQPSQQLAQG